MGDKTINVTGYGFDYVVTLDANDYPVSVQTTVNGVPMVATYSGYRDGLGMGGQPSFDVVAKLIDDGNIDAIAESSGPLDKYRVGVFYPEKVTLQVGGRTVLDVNVTQGWSGRYSIFPDPELVRAPKL
jgi:hypothetical protein